MDYRAPLSTIRQTLSAAGFDALFDLPAFEAMTPDLVEAVLSEAARFAENIVAPINAAMDREGCVLDNGVVRTPTGFVEAYRAFAETGWMSLATDQEIGGQGLPISLGAAISEILSAASLSFNSLPTLTQSAIEAIGAHGSQEQKDVYLAKLVSGEWMATMNLTEPQAGSDVGSVRTMARQADDGQWRVKGQKIFITGGDHDLTENIVHLVLARTPGAPPGTKGISLFLVPKYRVTDEGTLGARNDVRVVAVEHKLGLRASPTCALSYGDNDDCIGLLVGEINGGMRGMFTMMNHARLTVALQGPAIADRAYQQALAYAHQRVQGVPVGSPAGTPIVGHLDVQRMLLTMAALTQAARGICYANAVSLDVARHDPNEARRDAARARASLLTPIAKAHASDIGMEVASIGIQIHGGMGFIEETGAAQHYRDSRIAPIYEGTNGIQALDLVNRKLRHDGGRAAAALIAELHADAVTAAAHGIDYVESVDRLADAVRWVLAAEPADAAAAATPFLGLFGVVLGAHVLAAVDNERARATAYFYVDHVLPRGTSLYRQVTAGAGSIVAASQLELTRA